MFVPPDVQQDMNPGTVPQVRVIVAISMPRNACQPSNGQLYGANIAAVANSACAQSQQDHVISSSLAMN